MVLKSFAETLKKAEPDVGIPIMADGFARWGKDIQRDAEALWPTIADRVLKEYATRLFIDIDMASPIEQKLYLALHAHLIDQLVNYPTTTCLQVSQKVSAVSAFLRAKGQASVFERGDVDFEIDVFLYLDCYLIDVGGRNVRCPFFMGIECDGHDYHERTKEQAAKDRSKDRILKVRGLEIIRFTGSEINRDPARCVAEIDQLIEAHLGRVQRLLADNAQRQS